MFVLLKESKTYLSEGKGAIYKGIAVCGLEFWVTPAFFPPIKA